MSDEELLDLTIKLDHLSERLGSFIAQFNSRLDSLQARVDLLARQIEDQRSGATSFQVVTSAASVFPLRVLKVPVTTTIAWLPRSLLCLTLWFVCAHLSLHRGWISEPVQSALGKQGGGQDLFWPGVSEESVRQSPLSLPTAATSSFAQKVSMPTFVLEGQ